jgi:putative transposase
MGLLPREQLRQLIKENDIKDVNGIYDTLKDMFKDVLQEMLEAEMDVTLGYGKNEAKDKDTTNIRNGYSSKTLKTKFGNIEMDIPSVNAGLFLTESPVEN